ncbi:MAG: Asp-tRNA(Asn)/Glu-tRNA(Gln) amidotransferase subunit GatA [Armatimonadetes bacterium]|nr:Asp-tRNA(Asn)/Glu-tRNA(Gln) amidotransferase subunit GatA [Armatimonadota bacterium]
MSLTELSAYELSLKLQSGEVSAREAVAACFDKIGQVEDDVKAFVLLTRDHAEAAAAEIDEKRAAGEKLGPLAGVPIAHKDLFCTRGVRTTCCSKILENFVPPYDATVVARCHEAGMPMLGKTNMDEFAMGSSTENSALQITRNPLDLDKVPGGSSGGSAAAVAAGEAFLALGTDTGGSIRQPASLCGIVGMKPTYGRVSRYGVIAYASSLDQVGPFARDVRDCALLLQTIAGPDPMDSTCAGMEPPDYLACLGDDVKGLKAGIVKELVYGEGIHAPVKESILQAVETLTSLGVECEEVSLPNIDYSLPVYYIIAPAECSSNLARYDGVRYGHRTELPSEDIHDMYSKTRAEGFGDEVRLRIMLGTYTLSAGYYDAYYKKALQVRTLIKRDFDEAFGKFDILLSPTSPCVAWNFGAFDQMAMKLADICTIPVNIAGICAMNVPCGMQDHLPIGLQIMGAPFTEDTVLRAGYAFEQARK